MLVKLLMVFAEFERASIISRVTQAYVHRSQMGFYMGGRRPYGFELVPAVIHNIQTKKLRPIPSEAEQVQYIYRTYAQAGMSLRQLQQKLLAEGRQPLHGSGWTTAKLSALLKNPLYVKADSDVYRYFDCRGTQIVTDLSLFTGENGAQLYGRTKHDPGNPCWSDMRLVLLTHPGLVDSPVWLQCQQKLEKNRRIGNSASNRTSWLAGKVVCESCGHTMTTVKGKPNRNGQVRRYFHCTGKTHKGTCTGPKATIYAEDLERLVYDCILQKLADLKDPGRFAKSRDLPGANSLKLRIAAIEKAEQQLVDALLAGGFHTEMLALANQKAAQLKRDKQALYEQLEKLACREEGAGTAIKLAEAWTTAGYTQRKAAAGMILHKILIRPDGSVKILWNL